VMEGNRVTVGVEKCCGMGQCCICGGCQVIREGQNVVRRRSKGEGK